MKINAVPLFQSSVLDEEQETTEPEAEVTMLEILGPFDPANTVVKLARELVRETGSESMIDSFERAIKEQAVAENKK